MGNLEQVDSGRIDGRSVKMPPTPVESLSEFHWGNDLSTTVTRLSQSPTIELFWLPAVRESFCHLNYLTGVDMTYYNSEWSGVMLRLNELYQIESNIGTANNMSESERAEYFSEVVAGLRTYQTNTLMPYSAYVLDRPVSQTGLPKDLQDVFKQRVLELAGKTAEELDLLSDTVKNLDPSTLENRRELARLCQCACEKIFGPDEARHYRFYYNENRS